MTAGELRYAVTAVLDRQRRKVVSCIIEGFVFLICQKSLEAFRHEISINDQLVLVDDEARLPSVEEESDTKITWSQTVPWTFATWSRTRCCCRCRWCR
jgi:uncharacterized metal-binding protein YceD (DUF177 family)